MLAIDKALNKRGNRIVSIADPVIAEKREAYAFLNGFVMGVTVSHTQPVNNPEKVTVAAQEPRREARKFLAVMVAIFALASFSMAAFAAGWHSGDAGMQQRYIDMVNHLKGQNWAPMPYGEPVFKYNREKGIRE